MSGIDKLKTQAENAYRRGELKDALNTYRRLERLRPTDPEIANDLGTVLFAAGHLSESRRYYRRALDLRPGHPQAQRNLNTLRRAIAASTGVPGQRGHSARVPARMKSHRTGELPCWERVVQRARRLLAGERPRDAFRAVLGFRLSTGRPRATDFLRRRFRGTEVKLQLVMDQGVSEMIMLTPALRAIRQALPRSKVEVVGKVSALEVVEGLEFVDGTIPLTDYSADAETDALLLSIWSDEFSNQHIELARQLRCPVCGLANPFAQCRAQEVFARRAGWPLREGAEDASCHEAELQMNLARILGFRGEECDPACTTEKTEWPFQDDRKVVLVAATAGEDEMSGRKRWPHYPELANRLLRAGYEVGAIRNSTGASPAAADEWPEGVRKLEGNYSVPETAGLIRRADLLVANDSDEAHIGGAVGTETIVLFGPSCESRCKPWGDEVGVLTSDAGCRPCQDLPSWKHCEHAQCMEVLSVERVMKAVTGEDVACHPQPPVREAGECVEATALVKIDLGCGTRKRKGFIGIDADPRSAADIVCDITKGIPLGDDSVDYLVADNVLEHVGDDFVGVINEIWRICRASGKVEVTVPADAPRHGVSNSKTPACFTGRMLHHLDRQSAKYGQPYGFRPFDIRHRRKHAGSVEIEMSPFKGAVTRNGVELQRERKPQVCFVTHNQPLASGGERAMHHLANRLARAGYTVRVIYNRTPFSHPPGVDEPENCAYAVEWVQGRDVESFARAVSEAVKGRSGRAEVCLPLTDAHSARLVSACREKGIIVGTWCLNAKHPEDQRIREVFKECDFVVAASPPIRGLIKERFERTRDVFIIPHAAADVFFNSYEERRQKELNRFLFFGRLSFTHEGLDALCRAVAQVKQDGPAVSLDIVGTGPDEELLRSIVGILGLGAEVRVLGWKSADQLAAMMPEYDLCVLPSKEQGNSLPVIEAMATGTPVITTPVGATPWIMTHRKHGLLVPAGRPDALAEAIRWAREHPAEVNLMGRWGYKKAAREYHWDAVVERYAQMLHRVFTRYSSRAQHA